MLLLLLIFFPVFYLAFYANPQIATTVPRLTNTKAQVPLVSSLAADTGGGDLSEVLACVVGRGGVTTYVVRLGCLVSVCQITEHSGIDSVDGVLLKGSDVVKGIVVTGERDFVGSEDDDVVVSSAVVSGGHSFEMVQIAVGCEVTAAMVLE